MIRDRLRRFRNIERARPAEPEAAPGEAPERFQRVEGPGAPAPEPVIPASATDRFRPPAERPLEVAERRDEEQPFRRCARCEMDNARFAEACQNCGADLRRPDQEEFNRRLWAARRAEAAEEARALAERGRERERLAAEAERAKVALATEMARLEAGRVESELDEAWQRDQWGRWRGFGEDPVPPAWRDPDAEWGRPPRAPPGLRLLRSIRSPLLRVAVILAALAVPVALVAAGREGDHLRLAGAIAGAVLLALVAPTRWRTRRLGRFWDW